MRNLILLAAPLLLVIGQPAKAAPPEWRVSEVAGQVQIVEGGRTRAATRGALLSSGATVATGPGARAVLVRGAETVTVSPRSRVRIPEAAERGGVLQMIADFGTALFRIEKKQRPHFKVDTPYLAAVVKGTTFTVSVGPAGASVQVTEGAVEVATLDGGARDLLRPGMIARVSARDLGALRIDGDGEPRAIRSPNAAAPSPAARRDGEGSGRGAVTIKVPVAEAPVSLASLTGGLLDGSAGLDIATAAAADARRDERASGPGGPADPGRPDDPGNGGGRPDEPGNGAGGQPQDPGNGGGRPDEPGNGSGGQPNTPGGPPADPGYGGSGGGSGGNPGTPPGSGDHGGTPGGPGDNPADPQGPPPGAGQGDHGPPSSPPGDPGGPPRP